MDTSATTSPPDPPDGVAETFDRAAIQAVARFALAVSPAMLFQNFSDRALHLTLPPGKQPRRNARIAREYTRLFDYLVHRAGDSSQHLLA
jgi:polyhydroxyalkanoate synthase